MALYAGCGDDDGNGGGPGAGANGVGASGTGNNGVGGKGEPIEPPPPACDAADNGSADVSEPTLIGGLSDGSAEGWLGSPAIVDVDGDGTPEIVASRHGNVSAWHADGTVVFSADVDGRCWSSPIVADIRTDLPGLEIAQASDDKIYAWQLDGTPLPGFPYAWQGELRSLAAGDIDGDGQLELVSVTTQKLQANGQTDIIIAVENDGSVVSGFPPNTSGASGCDDACYLHNGYDQNIALGDVDGDGVADIFATQDNAYNSLHKGDGYAFDCHESFNNKTKFPGIRGMHDFAEAQQGYADDEDTGLQAHHTNTAPALADVDGDGVAELVYLASVQNAAQTDREKGVALWVLENDGTRPPGWETPVHMDGYLSGLWDYGDNIVGITNQVTVADIDPDRDGPEMIFAGFDGKIHAVDSQANVMWSVNYTNDDQGGTAGVVVGDLSGDGAPEIVFATYSNNEGISALVVLDGGGNQLHSVPLPGRGAMAAPTLGDADGNGTLEIAVSLKDADNGTQVQLYEVASASDNCLLWPTGRGNYRRDGYVAPGE